jgi:copper resistance protein C
MRRSGSIAAFLFALAVAAWPVAASAHAFPTAESPAAGAELDKSPPGVRIHFDSPIEPDFSKLTVTDSAGADVTAGPPVVDSVRREFAVKLKPLGPGDYMVHWSVVAEDGHHTEGQYSFTIINLTGAAR